MPTQAQSLLERGSYLVNGPMMCNHCHTPKDVAGNPIMDRQFSGGAQRFDELAFTVTGSNITPDRETGVGNWSDAELKRALVEGKRPNGAPLANVMPYSLYRSLAPGDLDAVVAYMRSVPAISNKVAMSIYKAEQVNYPYPGAENPMSETDMRDPVKRGLYLGALGHCMQCHAERTKDVPNYRTGAGKGGREFKTPAGLARAANITSHAKSGLGAWSDAEIKRALTEAVSRDGRRLAPTMASYRLYLQRFTSGDLDALVAWMRTLPPIE
ncbi:MAG: phosphomannomutase [Betaproteobacteria bacterium]|nr:phosphomannomutase [Betaproteobacteria bacterium]